MDAGEIARLAREIEDPQARRQFLQRICADNQALQNQVERLLLQAETPPSASAAETLEFSAAKRAGSARSEGIPDRVEQFELLEEVGQGGVGVVYLARDTQLARTVAIKFLRPEFRKHPSAITRFVTEAQITGQLQHPGIPPVHSLGRLPDGSPYLVMKLIKGQTLRHLLQQRHSPDERLDYFIGIFEQVCHAVGYAHAHRVIHRDLKPANIMVGAHGEVQVMDWGLAKVLQESPPGKAPPRSSSPPSVPMTAIETPLRHGSVTMTGQALGTPAYMAPEQAGGELDRLDARCDVFGLGAVLCEILTGHPPYLGRDGHEVLLKAVRGDLEEAYQRLQRCSAPEELVQLCRQALAFDPDCRPASATELAQAIAQIRQQAQQRARQAELQKAEALARAAEAHRRRRVVLWASVSIIGLLLIGLGAISYALVQVRHQKQLAEQQRQLAQQHYREALAQRDARTQALQAAVNALQTATDRAIQHWLAQPGLDQTHRRQFLRQLLGRYEKLASLAGSDVQGMRIRADGLARIGSIRRLLGEHRQAEESFRQSVALYRQLLQRDPESESIQGALAAVLNNLGVLLMDQGRHEEAASALREAIELAQAALGKAAPEDKPRFARTLAATWNSLGSIYASAQQFEKALPAYQNAIRLAQQHVHAAPDPLAAQNELARYYLNYGNMLFHQKRYSEALEPIRQARQIRQQLVERFGPVPRLIQGLALATDRLGALYRQQKKYDQAQSLFSQAIALRRQLCDLYPQVPDYKFALADSWHGLAMLVHLQRKFQEAQKFYRQAIEVKQQLCQEHPQVGQYRRSLAASLMNLAAAQMELNELEQALNTFEQARKILTQLVQDYPQHALYRNTLANCLRYQAMVLEKQGRFSEVRQCWEEALVHLERLHQLLPGQKAVQLKLINQLLQLAQWHLQRGKAETALEYLHRAQPLLEPLVHRGASQRVLEMGLTHMSLLAQAHALLQDQEKAYHFARRIAQLGWHPGHDAYNAARVMMKCARRVAQRRPNSNAAVAFFHERAWEFLQQGIRHGLDPKVVQKDKLFEPLHSHAEFRQQFLVPVSKLSGDSASESRASTPQP